MRHGNGCRLSVNQVCIYSISNAANKFPFFDIVAGESGTDTGHQDNYASRAAPMFRHPQTDALPFVQVPLLKSKSYQRFYSNT